MTDSIFYTQCIVINCLLTVFTKINQLGNQISTLSHLNVTIMLCSPTCKLKIRGLDKQLIYINTV